MQRRKTHKKHWTSGLQYDPSRFHFEYDEGKHVLILESETAALSRLLAYAITFGIPFIVSTLFLLLSFSFSVKALTLLLAVAVIVSLNSEIGISVDPRLNTIETHYLLLGFLPYTTSLWLGNYDSVGYFVLRGSNGFSAQIRAISKNRGRTLLKFSGSRDAPEAALTELTNQFGEVCNLRSVGKQPYTRFLFW